MQKQKSNAIPGTIHSGITTNAAYKRHLHLMRNGSAKMRSISNKGFVHGFNK
jgi:hypothetical protein